MNLINFLDSGEFCTNLSPILKLVGILVFGIKVVVPIILIIVGMFDMAKAVTAKDENAIKAAQQALIKKAIAAVLVFLVATIVGILMSLVGGEDYKDCMTCVNSPWGGDCKNLVESAESTISGTTSDSE